MIRCACRRLMQRPPDLRVHAHRIAHELDVGLRERGIGADDDVAAADLGREGTRAEQPSSAAARMPRDRRAARAGTKRARASRTAGPRAGVRRDSRPTPGRSACTRMPCAATRRPARSRTAAAAARELYVPPHRITSRSANTWRVSLPRTQLDADRADRLPTSTRVVSAPCITSRFGAMPHRMQIGARRAGAPPARSPP